ncbi:uncharacterized protein PHALS_08749 [Plasmopara halstedii]|uniref:RxLR-like protein n=1 Tax=Plasmopara halstedii TaxID=4781 RepID=A0A0P1ADU9_PLAHL|nr:uncharacterized protein PHALS_08749 [Plasmopara halstedii]CEG38690.1 hypothetical protein PHALS_08749 [Plasmopara halstedii]|eukprot:XP_024575059.1 hypothetical protein PHALS_08749 [Plasmopara halstedii]
MHLKLAFKKHASSEYISSVEKALENLFQFPAFDYDVSNIFKNAEKLDIITGSIERSVLSEKYLNKVYEDFKMMKKRIPKGVHAEEITRRVLSKSLKDLLFIINVIKAQRIIDLGQIPNLQPELITLFKNYVFALWKSQGMKLDRLSKILAHTDDPENNLVKSYKLYLSMKTKLVLLDQTNH